MSNLEAFVNSVRNLYQQQQQQQQTSIGNVNYVEIYNTLQSSVDALSDEPTNLIENVLPVFPLPEFTLPHLFVLYAVINRIQQILKNNPNALAAPSDAVQAETTSTNSTTTTTTNSINLSIAGLSVDRLLRLIEDSIQLSDERQLELAVEVYAELCHFYTNRLCQLNRAKRGLSVLRTAIVKIQQDTSTGQRRANQLTLVHSDLMQLSLAAKNFTVALELLSHDILDINKPASGSFDSRYFLGYFYYAGCVHAALKQFDSALFYLEQALIVPGTALSSIVIESYKKLIMISLIYKGKMPSLPKYTSRIVISHVKPICSAYNDLAQAFLSFDQDKLNAVCAKHNDTFVQDKNIGLVKQLQSALYKKNIQKLTKTFITLSLSDMAARVKLSSAREAETIMLDMIRDGEIFATINQKDGMVSFHDDPEQYDNPAITEELIRQMQACIDLDAHIKAMDKEISTHPQYIQKCQNNLAKTSMIGADDASDPLF